MSRDKSEYQEAMRRKGYTFDGKQFTKTDPFTKQKVVWNEATGNGERICTRNPIVIETKAPTVTAASMLPKVSTDEAKLNKTEKARLDYLRMLDFDVKVQAITLKIADDCRFTADFTYLDFNGRMIFEDVKGFQREDALIKIKNCARQFRFFDFVIVKKTKSGWDVTEVKP